MPTDIICPKCGSEMVLRTAKKGPNASREFYVCINYPECKGKIPVRTRIDTAVPVEQYPTVQCPFCNLREVETIATARYVRGLIIAVQFASYRLIGCVPCVRSQLLKQAFLSLFLGWFSLRALITNPFLILYNFIRALTLRQNLSNMDMMALAAINYGQITAPQCPFCRSSDGVRYSTLNNMWTCYDCGHDFDPLNPFGSDIDLSSDYKPSHHSKYYRTTSAARTKRKRRFPYTAVVIVVLILAATGVALWWFLPTYSLTLVAIPSEGGIVTGSGDYHRSTNAEITAIPVNCFEFTGWTGLDVANPSSTSTTVYIGSNKVVTAIFERYCIPSSASHPYWEYFDRQPPYSTTFFGEQVNLINNENASDPTWQELKSFLTADSTDEHYYNLINYPCGVFAEELHNNAEEAGIKAAWVAIEFEDDGDDHALNAFNTLDQGSVFVDCTGQGFASFLNYGGSDSNDKIAFIELGKEYGLISLDVVDAFSYGAYEEYMQEWEVYESSLEDYNEELDAYNRLYMSCGGTCTYTVGLCDCNTMDNWYYKLERWSNQLDRQYEELGEYYWEQLGVVDKVSMWW